MNNVQRPKVDPYHMTFTQEIFAQSNERNFNWLKQLRLFILLHVHMHVHSTPTLPLVPIIVWSSSLYSCHSLGMSADKNPTREMFIVEVKKRSNMLTCLWWTVSDVSIYNKFSSWKTEPNTSWYKNNSFWRTWPWISRAFFVRKKNLYSDLAFEHSNWFFSGKNTSSFNRPRFTLSKPTLAEENNF